MLKIIQFAVNLKQISYICQFNEKALIPVRLGSPHESSLIWLRPQIPFNYILEFTHGSGEWIDLCSITFFDRRADDGIKVESRNPGTPRSVWAEVPSSLSVLLSDRWVCHIVDDEEGGETWGLWGTTPTFRMMGQADQQSSRV